MGVLHIMSDETQDVHLDHWKEMIKQTEEMVNTWKDAQEEIPYYNQICKSWENFIEKQKEEFQYHLRRIGAPSKEQDQE